MDKLKAKAAGLKRRQRRVRGKITGTPECPRLRVTRSNQNIYAQVIDDVAGKTLCSASSLDAEFKQLDKNGATVEGAAVVGELVGKRAKDAKIETLFSTVVGTCTMAGSKRWQTARVAPG